MIKHYPLFIALFLCSITLAGCSNSTNKHQLLGTWTSEDKKTVLKLTSKAFMLDEGETPIAESYFVKGDTIFTSYEGAEPYTKFLIKDLTDNSMTLVYPDST